MLGQLMHPNPSAPAERCGATLRENTTAPLIEKDASPAAEPQPAPGRRRGAAAAVLAAPLASSLILTACYFPLSWGWLAWVGLVPLFVLVRTRVRPAWVYLSAWAAGLTFFAVVLSWMPACNEMMRNGWYGLSLYCSLYYPLAVFLWRVLDRRTGLPLTLAAPVVVVTLDFFRSFFLTGFAWYYLGHTQHVFLPAIQVADLGGVYLVTFLVVMVNAAVFDWLCAVPALRRAFALAEPEPARVPSLRRFRAWQTVAVAATVFAALCYGGWRLAQDTAEPGPRVALLQGSLEQRLRNSEKAVDLLRSDYAPLLDYAASYPFGIDLIVWPETSFFGWWQEANPDIPFHELPDGWTAQERLLRQHLRALVTASNTNQLIGLSTFSLQSPKKEVVYNSALYMRKNGTTGGRYDKIHRLPFGEYTPLDWPIFRAFSPYEHGQDYAIRGIAAGKNLRRFTLGDYTFGVLICYEDTDPMLARQYATTKEAATSVNPLVWLENLRRHFDRVAQEDGKPVDFLVNMSNDGWYVGTSEHNEHLALARFRAVETRRALVRAVHMGISAVIDGNGRVLKPTLVRHDVRQNADEVFYWDVIRDRPNENDELPVRNWDDFKKKSGVLTAIVPIDNRTSLYALCGDWLAYLCGALLLAGLVRARWPRRRKEECRMSNVE